MPLLVFAHGAGAPSTSAWMRGWAARLAALGAVETFDYPYAAAGRRRPDPLPRLVAAHRAAVEAARARHPDAGPVVLVGKSLGSRVGCHLASEGAPGPVAALVCLGYPLVSPSNPARLRNAVLEALATPILFVQGTRDPLCPLELLAEVRGRLHAPSALHVVEGGDHSLTLRKRDAACRGVTQDGSDAAALGAIARFLRVHASGNARGAPTGRDR